MSMPGHACEHSWERALLCLGTGALSGVRRTLLAAMRASRSLIILV
jgi:hypothetical protein